jgi:hypothetical protein
MTAESTGAAKAQADSNFDLSERILNDKQHKNERTEQVSVEANEQHRLLVESEVWWDMGQLFPDV